MASEVQRISSDGNWKVSVEAWKNNFLFYSSIGAQFWIEQKDGSSVWGGTSWKDGRAKRVVMHNSYNGGMAVQDGAWANVESGELKHWAAGLSVKIPSGSVSPGGPWLTLNSVESDIAVTLANGESMSFRVSASGITDSSIW